MTVSNLKLVERDNMDKQKALDKAYLLMRKEYMNKNNTLVIYTPAIPSSLKILDYFISNDFVVIKRSEALGLIANSSFCVAIAGTHGKTTTTSILGHLLKYCNKSATTFLGGISLFRRLCVGGRRGLKKLKKKLMQLE